MSININLDFLSDKQYNEYDPNNVLPDKPVIGEEYGAEPVKTEYSLLYEPYNLKYEDEQEDFNLLIDGNYTFVDHNDPFVKPKRNNQLLEHSLNFIAEKILLHHNIIQDLVYKAENTNQDKIFEIMKDFSSELNNLKIYNEQLEHRVSKIERSSKSYEEQFGKLDNQIFLFTNIVSSVNDQFRTTVDRVETLEKKVYDLEESYEPGETSNLQKESRAFEYIKPPEVDLSNYATLDMVENFKSTFYKQIVKLNSDADEKFVRIQEYRTDAKSWKFKIQDISHKVNKCVMDLKDYSAESDMKIHQMIDRDEFLKQNKMTEEFIVSIQSEFQRKVTELKVKLDSTFKNKLNAKMRINLNPYTKDNEENYGFRIKGRGDQLDDTESDKTLVEPQSDLPIGSEENGDEITKQISNHSNTTLQKSIDNDDVNENKENQQSNKDLAENLPHDNELDNNSFKIISHSKKMFDTYQSKHKMDHKVDYVHQKLDKMRHGIEYDRTNDKLLKTSSIKMAKNNNNDDIFYSYVNVIDEKLQILDTKILEIGKYVETHINNLTEIFITEEKLNKMYKGISEILEKVSYLENNSINKVNLDDQLSQSNYLNDDYKKYISHEYNAMNQAFSELKDSYKEFEEKINTYFTKTKGLVNSFNEKFDKYCSIENLKEFERNMNEYFFGQLKSIKTILDNKASFDYVKKKIQTNNRTTLSPELNRMMSLDKKSNILNMSSTDLIKDDKLPSHRKTGKKISSSSYSTADNSNNKMSLTNVIVDLPRQSSLLVNYKQMKSDELIMSDKKESSDFTKNEDSAIKIPIFNSPQMNNGIRVYENSSDRMRLRFVRKNKSKTKGDRIINSSLDYASNDRLPVISGRDTNSNFDFFNK